MVPSHEPTNEAIISDTLCVAPDVSFVTQDGAVCLGRWRTMVGSYRLPAMPRPIYVAHVGGKRNVLTWQDGSWSEHASHPSDSTVLPERLSSGWRVDGELDVATVSIKGVQSGGDKMRFAYSDPLGFALVRQALSVLYQPQTSVRDSYIEILMTTLRSHLLYGVSSDRLPEALYSADRVHRVLARINANPEGEFTLEELACEADLHPTYFSRVFRRATGAPPLSYITGKRIEKARNMLRHSALSVSAIADATGFKSQSHFSRVFQKHTGQTPSHFRSQKERS
ncbi:helix-turn-helix domain-containing protein [Bradyrhizobium brasilense]|uniref:helix-turn-helix domain-containing protein n=1 Tax=Bradyrhizobium brasilense TaxID=1419277 RepID=UPI001E504300|nr:AraC family transcriptional regulator [Bradyrhizobium brasilense]MCC8971570.1 helix-turn-helix transcriptional regulator [Bradyrhizobium brasilense]